MKPVAMIALPALSGPGGATWIANEIQINRLEDQIWV
jgi:hypothetical protein